MAFGTGEHASTRGVLRLLERRIQPRARVLDVGTGSAILAIAAALLDAAHVHGVDSDDDALLNAAENLTANGVAERVTLERAHVDAEYLRQRRGQYDLVVANVLSGVLRPLLPALRETLRYGGALILGGILTSEAAAMITAANQAGLRLETDDREDGWWSGLLVVANQ
jgi:ribosomal protein L11 methyltransferase